MSIAEKEAELAHVRSLLEETNQMHKELTQSYEEKVC